MYRQNLYRRFPIVRITLSLFFVFILFILFVYPSPEGPFFNVLKFVIVITIGVIFYQLYSLTSLQEEQHSEENQRLTDEDIVLLNEEVEIKMSEVAGRLAPVTEFIFTYYSNFNVGLYLMNTSNTTFSLIEGSPLFSSEISLSDNTVSKFLNMDSPTFYTPHSGLEDVKHIFNQNVTLADSASILVSPISSNNQMVGFLVIQAEEFGEFEENDKEVAKHLCQMITKTLKDTSKLDILKIQNSFLMDMTSAHKEISIDNTKEELFDEFVKFCKRSLYYDKLTFTLIDDKKPNEVIIQIVDGFNADYKKGERLVLDESLHGNVLREGIPFRSPNIMLEKDVKGRFREGDLPDHSFTSFIGIPLNVNSHTIGSLILESFNPDQYSMNDLHMIEIFGSNICQILKWSEDYSVVKRSATHDGLTGLLNHRTFVERLNEEIDRANRFQTKLVLLILDLDKFKRINDTYGHLHGDFVLQETAKVLKQSVRNIDITARYGGEEFAIILLNASIKDTILSSKRVVSNVANHLFDKDGIQVRMTITGGVSEFPTDGTTDQELIAVADKAMYQIKRAGGNDVGLPSTFSA